MPVRSQAHGQPIATARYLLASFSNSSDGPAMPDEHADQRLLRFDTLTEDPGEIDELTRLMFGTTVRVERSDGRTPSLRLAQSAATDFGVQRVTWNVDGRCDVAPLDTFLCIRLRRGAYGLEQGTGRVMYTAGDMFLADPDRRVDAEVVGADLDSFTIERPALERIATQLSPSARGRLDYRRAVPVTAALRKELDDVLDDVGHALRDNDLLADNALIRAGLLYRFVATVCAAFELVPARNSERPASERSVRRALGYIDDHLAEPVTVADIAEHVGMSVRGLQAAFQRVLSTSPHAYLRTARLSAVRDALLDADDGATVSEIARRWGFAHLGRFAANYRDEFGELPSATLRS